MSVANHIEIRNNRSGQPRAYIVGTRIRVQDVYADSEVHGMSPDEIAAAYSHLTLAQVYAALAYYFDHREDIQNELRQDRDIVAEIKARSGPGPLERKLNGTEAQSDSLPS